VVTGFSVIEGLNLSGGNVGFGFLGDLGSWWLGVTKRKKLRVFGSKMLEAMRIMMLQSFQFSGTMGISMHGCLMDGNPGTSNETLGAKLPSLATEGMCFGRVIGWSLALPGQFLMDWSGGGRWNRRRQGSGFGGRLAFVIENRAGLFDGLL